MKPSVKYWAVVPAAGVGKRFNSHTPKQYAMLQNKPLIWHVLSHLEEALCFEKIVVVVSQEDQRAQELKSTFKNIEFVLGGKERCHSVLKGLLSLSSIAAPDDWVLVHDAVRPEINGRQIKQFIETIGDHKVGGLLGLPVRDTLKKVDESGYVIATIDRTHVWQAQTPQMFRYNLLCDALTKSIQYNELITDEASAIEWMGQRPMMVKSSVENIKVTYSGDLT